jgi:hypothetical protein
VAAVVVPLVLLAVLVLLIVIVLRRRASRGKRPLFGSDGHLVLPMQNNPLYGNDGAPPPALNPRKSNVYDIGPAATAAAPLEDYADPDTVSPPPYGRRLTQAPGGHAAPQPYDTLAGRQPASGQEPQLPYNTLASRMPPQEAAPQRYNGLRREQQPRAAWDENNYYEPMAPPRPALVAAPGTRTYANDDHAVYANDEAPVAVSHA